MNTLQKRNLLNEAAERSKYQPDRLFYIMIKDNQGAVTPNTEVAGALNNQGFKVYAKMKDGGLVL